jgi:hypothetical protein
MQRRDRGMAPVLALLRQPGVAGEVAACALGQLPEARETSGSPDILGPP